jgi:membrane protein YqaA with SNARE-associated domain
VCPDARRIGTVTSADASTADPPRAATLTAATESKTRTAQRPRWSDLLRRFGWVLSLALVVGLTVALLVAPINYRALGSSGYLGVFGATLAGTAAVIVPVPYLVAVVGAGSYLDPFAVAVVAGLAAALGELVGYLGGMTGRLLLPRNRWVQLLERGMKRFGSGVVFVGAVVPNPFFDAIGVVAGATRFPLALFVPACFLGKTVRFWILAAFGGHMFLG